MKSYRVHYMNKYPGCRVFDAENSLDVYGSDGSHKVSLRKNGSGQWMDFSESHGCDDRHDLAPIPKDSRAHKLYANGNVGKSEEYEERLSKGYEYAKGNGGKVSSIAELEEQAKSKPKA